MFGFMLHTIIEVLVATFIIWGLFNEKTLVDFEDRVFSIIKKKVRASRSKRNVYRHHNCRHFDDRNCA